MARRAWVVAGLVLAVAAPACGLSDRDTRNADGTLRVVASFYPLAEVAQRVGGDRVRVANLTPAGGEPHDFELTSRDLDRIETAAVLLYLGGGFQPAVERVVGRAGGEVVDVLTDELGLLGGEDEGDGHEHDDEHGTDPHVWLDPALLKRIVPRVESALAAADPAGATIYAANAAAYGGELDVLDRDYKNGLARCDRRVIVSAHASFGYLARRYDLVQEPITGLSPEAEPDPRRLAELAAKVRRQGITTVFYESLVSPKVAHTLAREAGVTTAVLDPIEGLTKDDQREGKTYLSIMRDNLAALRTALGCG